MNERKGVEWGDLELFCVCRYILRRFWMVAFSALVCVMAVFLVQNIASTPTYTSSVTFAVTSRSTIGTTTNNIAVTGTVAGRFGQLLQSDIMKNAAAERLGMSSFPATISVDAPDNTNIVMMYVSASSPELAYKSTLAIIDCHKHYIDAVMKSAVLENINGPTIAVAPDSSSSRSTLLTLSAPLGALVMIFLLVMFCIREDTVHTSSGARHQIDGKLLATIRHERKHRTVKSLFSRKKKSLLISDPTCSFLYTETIHQLRILLERAKEVKHHQVFVIASCSENEGKSTIAANLALSLAQKHHKVLLLDGDLRKPAQSLIFDKHISHGKHFGSIVTNPFSKKALKEAIQHDTATNLYFLFSNSIERRKMEILSADTFRPIIDALRQEFSYIIIDTPPSGLFADAEVLADVSDASLLVVRQDLLPAIAINDTIDSLSTAKAEFMGIVLNNVHAIRNPISSSNGYGYGYRYGDGYGYGYGRHAKKETSSFSEKGGI